MHRDLKPSNVRIDSHGHARVLDFGLARLLGGSNLRGVTELTMTADRQIVGSLPYASPEQLRGDRELSAPTDVYAIGLMLYEAVAGEPAYRSDVPMPELIKNILHYEPKRPSTRPSRRHGVDRSLNNVLARCLAKSPADRFTNAAMLAADLEAISEGAACFFAGRSASSAADDDYSYVAAVAHLSRFRHATDPVAVFAPASADSAANVSSGGFEVVHELGRHDVAADSVGRNVSSKAVGNAVG